MNTSSHVEFDRINAAILPHAVDFCQNLMPGGRVVGNEYVAGDINGGPGDSCKVNLQTGKWADFADTDKGGDLISLYAAKRGISQVEAARELSSEYGIEDSGGAPFTPSENLAPIHVAPIPDDAPEPPKTHFRHGRPSKTWTYRDAEGRPLFQVYRFDPAGSKKEVLPVTLWRKAQGATEWQFKGFPDPRPLYGLDRLANASANHPVLLVEGEKTADAAQRLVPEAVVMTWPGGSKAVAKVNFSPLHGRSVFIWPDADKPGAEAALAVADKLAKAGAAEVHIVLPPDGVAVGWDLADAAAESWESKGVVDYIQANKLDIGGFAALAQERYGIAGKVVTPTNKTPVVVGCPPEPLRRELPAPSPFPLNALGEVLGGAAQAMAEVIQAPNATCGQSVLAAAALAVQGYGDIEIDGRVFPISENFVSVGESGGRKSAVDQVALRPHREYEKALAERHSAEHEEYNIQLAAHKKCRDVALNKEKNKEDIQKRLRALGPEPTAPLSPILITEDPTIEGLVKLLTVGQPSMGLFSDEGGRMIGGYSMSPDNQLKTAAGLSGLWDGKPIDRVRGMDGASKIYGRRISLHLMVQPNVAGLLLSNDLLAGQGLLARCLTVFPESTAGSRLYNPVDISDHAAMLRYNDKMRDILETPLPLVEGKRNELAPPRLHLAPDAKKLWIEWHNFLESNLGDGGALSPIRAFASKAAEHAARLAGILTLTDDIHTREIPLDKMADGIELAKHYTAEALRLYHAGMTDPDLVLAERLLEWLREQGRSYVWSVLIYQYGPNGIRDSRIAKRIARILEEHHWLEPVVGGMVIDGKPRRDVWKVRI